jgi:hypothetical protein
MEDRQTCQLCNSSFKDSNEFILHCTRDPNHVSLCKQFMDEGYDAIFEMMDRKELEAKQKLEEKITMRLTKD